MVTIFTPTYNRRKELENLYESLLEQTNKDFEWLLVDDGSFDDTKEYIEKILKKNKININYIYKENGGKQSAYNVGLKNAKGEIFFCLDSDEILSPKAIETIINDFDNVNGNIGGYSYNRAYITSKDEVIGTKFPQDVKSAYYYDIYGKLGVTGDKLMVFKTKIAIEYPFPEIPGEKFVPEAVVFNRIAQKYKLGLSNEILSYTEYLPGGYSDNYFELVKRNPEGNIIYFKEKYNIEPSLYNVYGYILFCIYAKYSFGRTLREHKDKFRVLILYIPTLIVSKLKGR